MLYSVQLLLSFRRFGFSTFRAFSDGFVIHVSAHVAQEADYGATFPALGNMIDSVPETSMNGEMSALEPMKLDGFYDTVTTI